MTTAGSGLSGNYRMGTGPRVPALLGRSGMTGSLPLSGFLFFSLLSLVAAAVVAGTWFFRAAKCSVHSAFRPYHALAKTVVLQLEFG